MTGKGQTQTLRAVLGLRDRIIAGWLPPGARLYEVPLAAELGISRTPVREALARLAEEGLIERQPGGGYAVRSFSLADVRDAIELRGVMEGTAARLAAERGVAPDRLRAMQGLLDALDATVQGPEGVTDFGAYVELNAAFHAQLATLPGSDLIRAEVERANRMPFASPVAFLDAQQDVPGFRLSLYAAQQQHRAIVAAIEAREGARAEAVAREHARLARTNLEYVMFHDRSLIGRVPGLALVAS